MSKEEKMISFVESLKRSGIRISNEQTLIERLSQSADPEIELIKVAQNSRFSGVSFKASPDVPSDGLTKAFMDHGFDGFTFKDFIIHLKLE